MTGLRACKGQKRLWQLCHIAVRSADEDRFYQKKHPGPPLRVFLYRHGRSAWQLLFTIHEAEGGDQAYVKLHQLRSAAQKPLTKWPDER